VTDVQDVDRLLDSAQAEKKALLQQLVRYYLSQILHGCTNAHCTTPTCLSCNKRLASRPFRPPTQLTARALAFYLASQDHPRRAICPHPLKVDPSSSELDGVQQAKKDPKALGQNMYDTVRDRPIIICNHTTSGLATYIQAC
jgi:hypothetical protein